MINPHVIAPLDGEKRIIANFLRQEWVGDTCHPVGEEIPVDVTARVLALPAAEIHKIVDDREESDRLCRREADWHGGPFRVCVEQSILDYFGVERLSDITQEAVDAARSALVPREYAVMVTRTATRHATIRVSAVSFDDALDKAMASAPDHDFPSEAEANYEAVGASLVEEAPSRRARP